LTDCAALPPAESLDITVWAAWNVSELAEARKVELAVESEPPTLGHQQRTHLHLVCV